MLFSVFFLSQFHQLSSMSLTQVPKGGATIQILTLPAPWGEPSLMYMEKPTITLMSLKEPPPPPRHLNYDDPLNDLQPPV